MVGKLNVRLEFGDGARGKPGKWEEWTESECLINAFATQSIAKDEELLTDYGEDYWVGEVLAPQRNKSASG